jgi:hypothetical protein
MTVNYEIVSGRGSTGAGPRAEGSNGPDCESDRERRIYAARLEGMRGSGGLPSRSNMGDELAIQIGLGISSPMSMPMQALTPLLLPNSGSS